MKKYKLIKDYPFAPCEIGDIASPQPEGRFDLYPEFWEEVKEEIKEPLFITEDGKQLFENDTYWILNEHTGSYWKASGKLPKECDILIFSTKEAAEEWIKENKPKFSEKQILGAIDKVKDSFRRRNGGTMNDTCWSEFNMNEFKKELGL